MSNFHRLWELTQKDLLEGGLSDRERAELESLQINEDRLRRCTEKKKLKFPEKPDISDYYLV